jgi:hypothetical protein
VFGQDASDSSLWSGSGDDDIRLLLLLLLKKLTVVGRFAFL